MYVVHELLPVPIAKYLSGTKFKNTILDNWQTTVKGGEVVFTDLPITDGAHWFGGEPTSKVLKVLGMPPEKIVSQLAYSGAAMENVAGVMLKLKDTTSKYSSKEDMAEYLNTSLPYEEGKEYHIDVITANQGMFGGPPGDSMSLATFNSLSLTPANWGLIAVTNPYTSEGMGSYTVVRMTSGLFTGVGMDNTGVVMVLNGAGNNFTRVGARILSTRLVSWQEEEDDYSGAGATVMVTKYRRERKFRLAFRRTAEPFTVNSPAVWWIDNQLAHLKAIEGPVVRTALDIGSRDRPPVHLGFAERIRSINDSMFMEHQEDGPFLYTGSIITHGSIIPDTFLRYDYAKDLHYPEFIALISKYIDLDVTMDKASTFERIIGGILVIVAFVIAVILTVPSGGTSWVGFGATIGGLIGFGAAMITIVAIVVIAVMIAMFSFFLNLAAMLTDSLGLDGATAIIGNVVVRLEPLAKIAGYISLIYAVFRLVVVAVEALASEGVKEVTSGASKEAAANSLESSGLDTNALDDMLVGETMSVTGVDGNTLIISMGSDALYTVTNYTPLSGGVLTRTINMLSMVPKAGSTLSPTMGTIESMQKALGLFDTSFSIYKIINPIDTIPEIPGVEESKKIPSPHTSSFINLNFDTNARELPEIMESFYYNSTQGFLDRSVDPYVGLAAWPS